VGIPHSQFARRAAARIVPGSYARLRPAWAPKRTLEPIITDDEAEERLLTAWRYIAESEARQPGFIASSPQFVSAQASVLEILANKRAAGDTPDFS
jgi:hypothetical protein